MRFCEDQLQRQRDIEHPLNCIREAITRCLPQGSFRPANVARELGIAPALLYRRLKENHTSFQRLLDDARRSLAKRYLLETSLKLTEIAGLVGYSELSAFSRAARRWFGTSPAASGAKRLISTRRPEQPFGICEDFGVIEGEIEPSPIFKPCGGRCV
jgi:AraC-like DNA-binding protein